MSQTPCAVDGCERGARKRDWCNLHYCHGLRNGEIEPLPVLTVAERFATELERRPNGCLEWVGGTDKHGYGYTNANAKRIKTHRLAWELVNGPISEGLLVLHHCDNPPCCQMEPTEGFPDGHLFLGTHADNVADKITKDRQGPTWNARKTHCKHGHPFDEANTRVAPDGSRRTCLTCQQAASARNYAARQTSAKSSTEVGPP